MNEFTEIEVFLEFLGDAILITNDQSQIIFANTSCLKLFGYSKLGIKNMAVDSLIKPNSRLGHKAKVNTYIRNKSHPKVMMSRSVMPCVNSKGMDFHARISIASVDINGELCGIATIQDYSTIDDLKNEANEDNLTGFYNKRYLDKIIKKDYQLLWPSSAVGVIYFDLNRFKHVNDTYGHDVGDLLLIEISNRLKKTLRTSDLIFRVGGDEFLLLFKISNTDDYRTELETIGFKLHEIISKPVFISKIKDSITVGVSIGIGIYPYDNNDLSILISMVDKSMYESKSSGVTFSLVSEY